MQNLIKKIIYFSKKAANTGIENKVFESFVDEFYRQNKLADFENYSTEALYNFALSAYDFISNHSKSGLIFGFIIPKKIKSTLKVLIQLLKF